MKKINENQLQNLVAGKFWGYGKWNCRPMGANQCDCRRNYFVLWMAVDSQNGIFTGVGNGGCTNIN